MKAMVVSPVGGRVPSVRGVLQSRVETTTHSSSSSSRKDIEAAEVAANLTRLRHLIPYTGTRKLSKLEVIQLVIKYICDLQDALENNKQIAKPVGPRLPLQPLLNSSTADSTTTTDSTSTAER